MEPQAQPLATEVATTSSRVAGLEVAERRAGDAPILYIHGVPNSAAIWDPFLARTGGVAVDLPGFGRSDKPAGFDYSPAGYREFLLEYTEGRGRLSLVMHDWGAVGLLLAAARPDAIDRIVLLDAVPFLPGYRWHRIARVWRTRFLGELAMGFSTRGAFRLLARRTTTLPREAIDAAVDEIWRHFDHGTQRAILRLYRSAPEEALARAGEALARISSPALVVWGGRDPFLPTRFAHEYAAALGGTAAIVEGAGHWPWFDDSSVVERVAAFVAG